MLKNKKCQNLSCKVVMAHCTGEGGINQNWMYTNLLKVDVLTTIHFKCIRKKLSNKITKPQGGGGGHSTLVEPLIAKKFELHKLFVVSCQICKKKPAAKLRWWLAAEGRLAW